MYCYSLYGKTDVGCVRNNNEDVFIAEPAWHDGFVLCGAVDGVGGYDGGEIAASITKETMIESLASNAFDKPLDAVKHAFVQANNEIVKRQKVESMYSNMSCVASTALIDTRNQIAYIAHVGDSRIYLLDSLGLNKLTHDHSLVGYMEEQGELTEIQAMNHPRRNVIERSLGESFRTVDSDNWMENSIHRIPAGGILLFCSDGLTDMANSSEITAILQSCGTLDDKVDELINLAKDRGGKDNITVVLYRNDAEIKLDRPQITYSEPSANLRLATRQPEVERDKVNNKRRYSLFLLVIAVLSAFIAGALFSCLWLFSNNKNTVENTGISDNKFYYSDQKKSIDFFKSIIDTNNNDTYCFIDKDVDK